MYNFSVEDWHTYFVGEEKLWVHNAKCDVAGDTLKKATDLPTIKQGTKEWDDAVKAIKEGGNTNYRVDTATNAKNLLSEGRGNMNRYKQYTSDYKKGYEFHPNEAHTVNASHNNLPHIKWKDWLSENNSGKGHIFFDIPN